MPAAPRAAGPDEGVGRAADSGRHEDEVKPDAQSKLRITVSGQAVRNSQKLQEALDKVPEALKPALRQALEVASSGYEQALRNLD